MPDPHPEPFPLQLGRARYRALDISVALHGGIPRWPGDYHRFEHEFPKTMEQDGVCVSRLSFNLHTGTHLDAPSHHLEGGTTTDQVPLSRLIGPARVVDLRHVEGAVDAADLEPLGLERDSICLIKTRNEELWSRPEFSRDYVALTAGAATHLVERGVKMVGVDYLSVEPFGAQPQATHHTLLGAGVLILEGLYLAHVAAGEYTLICLPLKLVGAEAAPVRALLLQEEADGA